LTVCNEFGHNFPHTTYLEAFSQICAPVVFSIAAPNLEPRDDIWLTEIAPVFRRRETGWSWFNCAGGSRLRDQGTTLSSTFAPRGATFQSAVSYSGLALFRVHRTKVPKSK
jgi:hypothetical protein